MTTVARTARAIAGPPFVPVAVVLVLFGVALLMARVSPGRVSTGVYQVVVWEGMEHVVIPAESLTCGRSGGVTTCTAPVGADRLTVELAYSGVAEPGGCAAEYRDRVVSCARQMGFYGHASNTLWLHGLGLSPAQRAALAADVPWWRVERELMTAGMIGIGALGVLAGVVTFLLRRRVRVVPSWPRAAVVAGTAAVGMGLFFASGPLLGNPMRALGIVALLPLAALVAWQLEATGPPLVGRLRSAVIAGAATVFYSGCAVLIFGLQSGFLD
jgi:hypothetical protein